MKVVSKFGGSSVRNADALKKVAHIIQQTRPAIAVISATYNTTNELENLAKSEQENRQELLNLLLQKHLKMIEELGIENQCVANIEALIQEAAELLNDFNPYKMDQLYSIGERLSSKILYEYLKFQEVDCILLDARDLIRTNDQISAAIPDIVETTKNCSKHIKDFGKRLIVTQGFIGSTDDGVTTTLGREGSDYTAALLAEAFDANAVNIWTDVEGIATIDPRLCQNAHYLDHMSYEQAELLATNGAKVLFPTTMAPVRRKGIPLFVKSTFAPEIKGTCISRENKDSEKALAMAYENGVITIVSDSPDKLTEILDLPCVELGERFAKFEVPKEDLIKIHDLLFLS